MICGYCSYSDDKVIKLSFVKESKTTNWDNDSEEHAF